MNASHRKLAVAIGEYNDKLDERIAAIKAKCGDGK